MKEIFRAVKNYFKYIDHLLFSLMIVSSGLGCVIIHSATLSFNSNKFIFVQIAAIGLGILLFIISSAFDIEHLSSLWKWMFAFNLLMLASLQFLGTGMESTGNRSWIRFAGTGIQPAELGKIIFIITLARHMSLLKENINRVKSLLQLSVHIVLPTAFVALFSSDTGMAISYAVTALIMLFCAGVKFRWFAGLFAAFAVITPILWNFVLRNYQKLRILVLFDPSLDAKTAFQLKMSKLALGSGMLTGQGYMKGTQTQLSRLPAKHTDFIFSVAGEEFGFFGCLGIVALLTGIITRCFYNAYRALTPEGALICTGVGAMLLFQTFENIGMCVGVLPIIGLTLPFFSYGGSSIVSSFIALGIVAGIRMRSKIRNEHYDIRHMSE